MAHDHDRQKWRDRAARVNPPPRQGNEVHFNVQPPQAAPEQPVDHQFVAYRDRAHDRAYRTAIKKVLALVPDGERIADQIFDVKKVALSGDPEKPLPEFGEV